MGQLDKMNSKLRVCARCERIYWGIRSCPKCGFASYGAVWVYGGWVKAVWRWATRLSYS